MPSQIGIPANIRVIRAMFRQPIGVLNPMNLKVPMLMGVKLVRVSDGGKQFCAKWVDNNRPIGFGIHNDYAAELAQKLSVLFVEQVEPWRCYDLAGLHQPLIDEEFSKCLVARGVKLAIKSA